MFITGDEIRAIYELEFESYELSREDDPQCDPDIQALKVVGSFGGRKETYLIRSDENYEVVSVEKVTA